MSTKPPVITKIKGKILGNWKNTLTAVITILLIMAVRVHFAQVTNESYPQSEYSKDNTPPPVQGEATFNWFKGFVYAGIGITFLLFLYSMSLNSDWARNMMKMIRKSVLSTAVSILSDMEDSL